MRHFPVFLGLALYCGLLVASRCSQAQAVTANPLTTCIKSPPAAVKAEDDEGAELNRALAAAAFGDGTPRSTSPLPTTDLGPVGLVPYIRGFTASLTTTSQHDSAGGWQSILTPTIAYRFGRHFSALVQIPVYSYINIFGIQSVTPAKGDVPLLNDYGFKKRNFLLGDTSIFGQYEARFRPFDYNLTTTLGAPSGDDDNGLGAGQVTYNINNHFEHGFGNWFTPELELGLGNSPNLVDPRVRKSYIAVGTNAHFEAGVNLQLPFHMNFNSEAFEELPLGTVSVTSTTTNGKKGKKLKTITTTTNKSVGEDNGFLNTLDIPLTDHLTLSGFYNRSLRNKIDTAGFSFTFLLRGPPRGSENTR